MSERAQNIRVLMDAYPLEAQPPTPRVSVGINAIQLFRAGPLYYAFSTSAAKLWDWLPSGSFWHELTQYRHRLAFHGDRLGDVVQLCLDRGEAVCIFAQHP
jgi:hypothetical protein